MPLTTGLSTSVVRIENKRMSDEFSPLQMSMRRWMVRDLSAFDWDSLSLDELGKVWMLVEKEIAKSKGIDVSDCRRG